MRHNEVMSNPMNETGEASEPSDADEATTDFVDPELAAAQMARRAKAQAVRGGVLGAAMLAIGEIIEPTKTNVTIEQTADADRDTDDPLADIDFGSLPPLS